MVSADVLFILIGAIMVLAMHGGFAFLEVGTVRHKNQVNALVKIISDFCVSTIAYFFIGYMVAYGTNMLLSPDELVFENGYALVKFFFLLTFAAAIPAIIPKSPVTVGLPRVSAIPVGSPIRTRGGVVFV